MSKQGRKSEQSSAARTGHAELARGWRVARFLPIFEWLPRYGRDDIAGDLMAGAVVAIMLVPQSMAYAMLAGLPLQVGLYASILPLLLYALLGSSLIGKGGGPKERVERFVERKNGKAVAKATPKTKKHAL